MATTATFRAAMCASGPGVFERLQSQKLVVFRSPLVLFFTCYKNVVENARRSLKGLKHG